MSDYAAQMKAAARRCEAALEGIMEACAAKAPTNIVEAMRYSLCAGGKRLRPMLTLEAAKLAGGSEADAMPYACAIEMIHTYSLIHDDLPAMDNDTLRRGRPTNHMVYGEAMAIIAGDGLLNLAFETALDAALIQGERGVRAARALAQAGGACGMVGGQSYDIMEEKHGKTPPPIEVVHEMKTGALIKGAILSGLYAAGAQDALLRAMEQYAREFGVLFQVTDDLLDVEGDAGLLGKTTGKDARDGKRTYVTLYGLEAARAAARKRRDACVDIASAIPDGEFFVWLAQSMLQRRV